MLLVPLTDDGAMENQFQANHEVLMKTNIKFKLFKHLSVWFCRQRDRKTERQRDRKTERQREREKERQRDRGTEGQRDREKERKREREKERKREREKERKRERETDRQKLRETERETERQRDREILKMGDIRTNKKTLNYNLLAESKLNAIFYVQMRKLNRVSTCCRSFEILMTETCFYLKHQ